MTVVPLTSMPAATPLTGTELFYMQQAAADAKATISQITAMTGATVNCISTSNPTTTASASGTHLGLGTGTYGPAQVITPVRTGTILFHLCGTAQNAGSFVTFVHMRYGSGTPPANAAAQTGTQLTNSVTVFLVGGIECPFALVGAATGLTLGVAYWWDGVYSVSGSTGQVKNPIGCAVEL